MKKIFNKIYNVGYNLYFDKICHDIDIELQKRALKETADFIIEYMSNTKRFTNKFELLKYAIEKTDKHGYFLEFGVYKGKTINYMSRLETGHIFYGFDCFDGLPVDWRFGFEKGTFKTKLPEVNENVRLITGLFSDTFPKFLKENSGKISFIHIDCDLYSSAKDVFDCICPEMITENCLILFDEFFNYHNWKNGEYKAFTEFIEKTGIGYEYVAFNSKSEQVLVRLKN